jgi:hypothetical protein
VTGLTNVDVRGLAEVQRAMAKLEPAQLKQLMQKASSAGARTIKPYVKAETPKGRTGRLRRSISSGQARKNRPAAIVKFRPKVAYYRHMVVKGTRSHRIRFPDQKSGPYPVPKSEGNIQHPGSRGNDIMGRAWAAGERATLDAVNKVIHDYLEAI